MNFTSHSIRKLLVVSLISTLLTACGSDSSDSDPGVTVSYTGVTTQAVVDRTNAESIATAAATGNNKSDGLGSIFGVAVITSNNGPKKAMVQYLPKLLQPTVVEGLSQMSTSGSTITGFTSDSNGNLYGDCGGSATFSGNLTGGTFNFSNFCEYSIEGDTMSEPFIMNGAIGFSATYVNPQDPNTLQSLTLSFRYFTVEYAGITETIAGEMAIDINTGDVTLTLRYEDGGKVYQIVNYVYDDITGTLTGQFYHPDFGYVDIAGTGLSFDAITGLPCTGTVTLTGDTGSNAVFSATSCTTYSIDWDDGVGTTGTITGSWI